MRNRLVLLLIVAGIALCAQGCGMRSVLSQDVDGPEEDSVAGSGSAGTGPVAVDAGANDTHPCGRVGAQGCDVQDLDGHSCQSLGAGSGTLSCDPVTCTFDLSMCTGEPGGGAAGAPALFGGGLFGGNNAGGGSGALFGGNAAGSGGLFGAGSGGLFGAGSGGLFGAGSGGLFGAGSGGNQDPE